ncbi:MAG: SCO family protein [Crocinitomicaceae bacterium]|nr:SCO family protein [Crocinitomicaceae bacterium]
MQNKIKWIIGSVLCVSFIIGCTSEEEVQELVLPIWGERDVEYSMVDGVEVADTIYHQIPEFKYLNHDSIMVSSEEMKGKVWIVDFFFSHCPTICPPMTAQMKRLSDETQDLNEHLQFMSFSIDPDNDTPSHMRGYMEVYKIEVDNWQFFTGNEEATHLLAKEFFSGAQRDEFADGGFGHTPNFAIVDHNGHVRGVYNGIDPAQVDSLQSDLRKLLNAEYGVE